MIITIGFDPGLIQPAAAWWDGNHIKTQLIPVDKLKGLDRIQKIINFFFDPVYPEVIIMEGYAYGFGRGTSRLIDMGELCGIVKWEARKRGIKIIIIPPASLKKYATNKGNADKNAVRDACNKERQKEGLPWVETSDEADAYWLLHIGTELLRQDGLVSILPQYRLDVLEAIRNPKPKKSKERERL